MDVSAVAPGAGTPALPPRIVQPDLASHAVKAAASPIDLVGVSPPAAAEIADAPSPAPSIVSADLRALPMSVQDAPSPVPRAHFEGSA